MSRTDLQERVSSLLEQCGVRIDGDAPWDIHINNPDFFSRVIAHGSLGLGESYMDGWWDTPKLDEFLYRLLAAHIDESTGRLEDARLWLKAELLNLQCGKRAFEIGEAHYDLGNDLFRAMLGKRLVYS
jgi:cyclopropane-fatty-acyl-phospholipid synthase